MTANALVPTILTGILSLASISAQEPSGFTGVVVGNGLYLKIWTHAGSGAAERRSIRGSVSRASTGPVHRLLLDESRTIVFGYDIELQRADDTRFVLVLKPLDEKYVERMWPSQHHGMLRPAGPIPTFAAPRSTRLAIGDRATIDVLRHPRTGETISDVIELTTTIANNSPAASSQPTRERDSPKDRQSIRLAAPRILINGEQVWRSGPGGLVSGHLVMFYLPGKGGYFFAADAQPGYNFAPIASVDRNRLSFAIDGQTFECITETPILPNEKSASLWMLHDPAYVPSLRWSGRSSHEHVAPDANRPRMGAANSYDDWIKGPRH